MAWRYFNDSCTIALKNSATICLSYTGMMSVFSKPFSEHIEHLEQSLGKVEIKKEKIV